MKQIKHAIVDLGLDIIEWFEQLAKTIKRVPKPVPTLLAYNMDWFTNCNWIERLVAFKRVNDYTSR